MGPNLDYFTQRYQLSKEERRALYTQLQADVTALLDAVPEYEGLALETRHLFINNRAQVEAILMAPFKQSFTAMRDASTPPLDPIGALCGNEDSGSRMIMDATVNIKHDASESPPPPFRQPSIFWMNAISACVRSYAKMRYV